ncbi:MAG: universal stress protein [Verrucomicrobia bacterium]|nr:universal stress protein [Verrucomicrobiota bacterium]
MRSITHGVATGQRKKPETAKRPVERAAKRKLKIESILVPTDFSPLSRKAISYASKFVEHFGARIILLHVIEPPPSYLREFPAALGRDQMIGETKRLLESYASREIKLEHLDKTIVKFGKPYEQIIAAARALKADIIVLGTHGGERGRKEFLGSTAEKVVRYARCPVVTIRE